jgi:hypothetical protein
MICIKKLVDIFLPRSCVLLIFLHAFKKSIHEVECFYNINNSMIFNIIIQDNSSNLETDIQNFKIFVRGISCSAHFSSDQQICRNWIQTFKRHSTAALVAGIAQSVWRLARSRTEGGRFPAGARDFSLLYSVQTSSGIYPPLWPMEARECFPGSKVTEDSPQSSAEVKNGGGKTLLAAHLY